MAVGPNKVLVILNLYSDLWKTWDDSDLNGKNRVSQRRLECVECDFFSFLHLDVHVNMINWEVISYLFLPNKLSKTRLLKTTTRCFSGLRGSAGLLPNLIWDYSWGFQQLALQLGLEGLR